MAATGHCKIKTHYVHGGSSFLYKWSFFSSLDITSSFGVWHSRDSVNTGSHNNSDAAWLLVCDVWSPWLLSHTFQLVLLALSMRMGNKPVLTLIVRADRWRGSGRRRFCLPIMRLVKWELHWLSEQWTRNRSWLEVLTSHLLLCRSKNWHDRIMEGVTVFIVVVVLPYLFHRFLPLASFH